VASIVSDGTHVYVVRHAPPLKEGFCYGQCDVEVSLSAEEAAERVLPQIPYTIDRLYCSPSKRTHSLAMALSVRTGLEVIVDNRLKELHFGTWEGRTWSEIHLTEPDALNTWATQPMLIAPPQGESGRKLVLRILSFVHQTTLENALVVGHAGPIRALRALGALAPHARSAENIIRFDFDRAVMPLDVETISWK
jgi:alpha-ribazole phosphatase